MILCFTLTMPRCTSCNGRWSGEDRPHYLIRSFRGTKAGAKAQQIIDNQPYHYSWTDGWGAMIYVKEIDAREANRRRKQSAGFCGYDWMVATIISHGKILADHELPEKQTAGSCES